MPRKSLQIRCEITKQDGTLLKRPGTLLVANGSIPDYHRVLFGCYSMPISVVFVPLMCALHLLFGSSIAICSVCPIAPSSPEFRLATVQRYASMRGRLCFTNPLVDRSLELTDMRNTKPCGKNSLKYQPVNSVAVSEAHWDTSNAVALGAHSTQVSAPLIRRRIPERCL